MIPFPFSLCWVILSIFLFQIASAKLRLIGEDTTGYISHGYLEVQHEGKWGAICSDGWSEVDSYVACGNLGYPDVKVRADKSRRFTYRKESQLGRVLGKCSPITNRVSTVYALYLDIFICF